MLYATENAERGLTAIKSAQNTARASRLVTDRPRDSTSYVFKIFSMSSYLYNHSILDESETLKTIDEEVISKFLNSFPKCRDKYLTNKAINKLMSLFQITPVTRRLEKEAMRFVDKQVRLAEEEVLEYDN